MRKVQEYGSISLLIHKTLGTLHGEWIDQSRITIDEIIRTTNGN